MYERMRVYLCVYVYIYTHIRLSVCLCMESHRYTNTTAGMPEHTRGEGHGDEVEAGAAAEFEYITEIAMANNVVDDFLIIVIAGRHDHVVIRRHIGVIAHTLLCPLSRSGLGAGLGY